METILSQLGGLIYSMIPGQSRVGDEGGAGDEEGRGGEAGSWSPGDAEGQWEWESFKYYFTVYTGFNKTGCILTFTICLEEEGHQDIGMADTAFLKKMNIFVE